MSKVNYIDKLVESCQLIGEELLKEIDSFRKGAIPSHWEEASFRNKWFTLENIRFAFEHWANLFSSCNDIKKWLSQYSLPVAKLKKILLILPGNIPLVGLHDVLCTLFAGHQAYVKLSSDDQVLIKHVFCLLENSGLAAKGQIVFKEDLGKDFDAVIATGSNLSANTFRYYFQDFPSVIRGHRNSVAVLTGDEKPEELEALADDVFVYFGLGCRNVSYFLVPEGYDWKPWVEASGKYAHLLDHTPYSNNYLYYRGYFGMMLEKNVSDCGFFLLRPHEQIHSPISVIHYKFYQNLNEVRLFLLERNHLIQCIVSREKIIENTIPFGMTQKPAWNDYADNIDVMEFLTNL